MKNRCNFRTLMCEPVNLSLVEFQVCSILYGNSLVECSSFLVLLEYSTAGESFLLPFRIWITIWGMWISSLIIMLRKGFLPKSHKTNATLIQYCLPILLIHLRLSRAHTLFSKVPGIFFIPKKIKTFLNYHSKNF